MAEIEFSVIIELPEELEALKELIEEFKARFGTSVKLRQLDWENAWPELLSYALYGKEPDVSHIGSTWCSSLVEMNALRTIRPAEVAQLGGREAFLKPAWQSSLVEGDTRVWSIPWTGYTNFLAYRRDLFEKAGLPETTNLETADGIFHAVQSLADAGVRIPLLIPTTGNVDILHAAASWVWEAGGEFIDVLNKKIQFTQEATIHGLANYFELFRCLPAPVQAISATTAADQFAEGQAAISLVNTKSFLGLMRGGINPEIARHIGASAVSPTPWFGGGNLIIWKHTQYNVEKERASINLVRFLTSQDIQVSFNHQTDELPVTVAALETSFPASHPLSNALQRAVSNGKPYRATQLWGRVEKLLGQALELVAIEVREDPLCDKKAILTRHLTPLARRLELTLSTS